MGYTTDFWGEFVLDKPLTDKDYRFLIKLSQTRRMARNIEGYGVEGEFYVDGEGDYGQANEDNIVNYNKPPSTQPSLWLHWTPGEDGKSIVWDGGKKFYEYLEWLKYLVKSILEPRGYVLNGKVHYQGEDPDDFGYIVTENNVVKVSYGVIDYGPLEAV